MDISSGIQPYEKLSYAEMREQLAALARHFPDLIRLETAEDKLGIPYLVDCSDTTGDKCVLDIVTLTDFNSAKDEKAQVYISGALHGNERIGPHNAYYLIEYLASNFGKDPYLTHLLRTRELVITPMTNAYGFAHDIREEQTVMLNGSRLRTFDPNRDFPYNNSKSNCLNTVAGRTIYKLMVENLFVTAITFHGGINVIGYPWGSNNHILDKRSWNEYVANEAPDHVALQSLGSAMLEAAGDNIQSLASRQVIPKYILGDMTSAVYPVGGGMEDWAYGAGWDNQKSDAAFDKCTPQTSPALGDSFYSSSENIRCAVYLIETDPQKDPTWKTYGAREITNGSDGTFQVLRSSVEERNPVEGYDGHINRNLRLVTAMVDMSKPYIYVRKVEKVADEDDKVKVTFVLNGCSEIDRVSVTEDGVERVLAQDGLCNHNVPGDLLQSVFSVRVGAQASVQLGAVVDQSMAKSVDKGKVSPAEFVNKPQTHFAKLRLEDEYQVKQGGHQLRGGKQLKQDLTKMLSAVSTRGNLSEEDIMREWPWTIHDYSEDLNDQKSIVDGTEGDSKQPEQKRPFNLDDEENIDVPFWSSILPPTPTEATLGPEETVSSQTVVKPAAESDSGDSSATVQVIVTLLIFVILNGLVILACRYFLRKRRERIQLKKEMMRQGVDQISDVRI